MKGYGPHNGHDHEFSDARYDPYARVGDDSWGRLDRIEQLEELRAKREPEHEMTMRIYRAQGERDELDRPQISPWEMWAVIGVIIMVATASCAGFLWGFIALVS